MSNNWSQDDLPFLFKQDSIKSLFSDKRLSKDSSGQLVWVEWLTVSTRSERTFLWLYHVTKESSKVATVFISCLCLMKVPEMNDNSLPAVYIKKMLEVVPETLSVTHFYYIAYQGSNPKKSNATLQSKELVPHWEYS